MAVYEIFQKSPDGSSRWQLSVAGRYNTARKLQELTEISEGEFYAVDPESGETLSPSARPVKASTALQRNASRSDAA